MNLPTFLFICFLSLSVENFLNCYKMHSFHGSEDHGQIAYRERTTVHGPVRQIILLGALQVWLNTITKWVFFVWKFVFLVILNFRFSKLRTLFCVVMHCDISNGHKFKFYCYLTDTSFFSIFTSFSFSLISSERGAESYSVTFSAHFKESSVHSELTCKLAEITVIAVNKTFFGR